MIKRALAVAALLVAFLPAAQATCSGRFINPVTDVCWRCMFPLRIGNTVIWGRDQHDNDSSSGNNLLCNCGINYVGISTSFWEPSHMMDVSTDPYCTPSLGGKVLGDLGLPADADGGISQHPGTKGGMRMAYHYVAYRNPILVMLQVLSDNPCLDRSPFDILDFSAVNPGWIDEQIGAILNPDAFLYGTLQAIMSCIPVGACSTLESSDSACMWLRRAAHWCVGFNGATYPLSGTKAGDSILAASMNIAKRAFTLQHRTLRVWGTSGSRGMCGFYPQVLVDDTDYKLSMTYPSAQRSPIDGKCCQPFGASTLVWGAGRTWPITGEDFSYIAFKKRDCCMAGGRIDAE